MSDTIRALVVKVDGSVSYEHLPTGYPEFGQSFLEATQEIPNTYLECIYPRRDIVGWLDEEGGPLFKNLPRNPLAYAIYLALGGPRLIGDRVHGTVVFTGTKGEEVDDCPEIDDVVRSVKNTE